MALMFGSLTIPPARSVNAAAAGSATRQIAAAGDRACVPLTYGSDRLGGLILNIMPTTVGGSTVVVQVLWGFACDSVNDLRLNDQALAGGITATHYTGSQTAADPTLVSAFAAQGITYSDTLAGFAHSVFVFAASLFDGQLNFSARLRGRRLYDPRLDSTAGGSGAHRLAVPSTWTWSDNPALALADFLANTVYGVGDPVDWSTVAAAANHCDALIGSPAEKRRIVGVTFGAPALASDVAEALKVYAGCWTFAGSAGVRLLPDQDVADSAAYAHAAGQIASIEPLALRDLGNSPTAVEVLYTDISRVPYRQASAVASLPGAGTALPMRLSTVQLPGVQRYSQAYREAVERLNKLTLQDVSTTMEVFDAGIRHDVADIISVTHPIGLSSRRMRVTDVEMTSLGRWRLSLVEHDPAVYSTAVASLSLPADTGRIIGGDTAIAWADIPGKPANVAALAGTEPIQNTQIAVNGSGQLTGIGTGNNTAVANTNVSITAAGALLGAGGGQVSLSSLPGSIAAAQVADGAITTAKFAAGIEPVAIVSGSVIPAVKTTNAIYLTGTGKLYRWVGSAYTSEVPTSDLSGQILAPQLSVGIGGDNLLPNSNFRKHASGLPYGWAVYNNGATAASFAVSSGGLFGTNFARITATAATSSTLGLYTNAGVTGGGVSAWIAGQPFVLSIYARASSAGAAGRVLSMLFSNMAWDSAITLAAPPLINGTWQRYAWRVVPANNAFTATGELFFSWDGGGTLAAGSSYDVCAIMVQAGDTLTAYAPRAAEILPDTITATEIADNAITTPKLIAGAVVAGKIAAGAVEADKIAANAVTAVKIAAGSITTAKLAAGAVTANEIAANAIIAGKIAAGAVSATEIAAASITTAKLAANAVTANEIAANAITTGKIAADAVTAAKIDSRGLILRDDAGNVTFANGTAKPNICPNPDLIAGTSTTANGWNLVQSGNMLLTLRYTDPNYGPPWNPSQPMLYGYANDSTGLAYWISESRPVDTSKPLCVSGWVRRFVTTAGQYLGVVCYNTAGADIGIQYVALANQPAATTWTRYHGTIGPGQTVPFPAGTARCAVIFIPIYLSGVGGAFGTRFALNEGTSPSEAIELGGVSAWNPITPGNASTYIASAAIGSAFISDAAITNAKIASAAIDWAKIQNLVINTSGSIRSGKTGPTDTTLGYWIGFDAGQPKLVIGGGAGNRITIDSTTGGVTQEIPSSNLTVTGPQNGEAFGAFALASGGASANASLTFNADGSTSSGAAWYRAVTAGIGSAYWVRFTHIRGNVPGGVGASWLALSSARSVTLSATNQVKTSGVLWELSTSSTGSPIVASGNINMTAESYSGVIP